MIKSSLFNSPFRERVSKREEGRVGKRVVKVEEVRVGGREEDVTPIWGCEGSIGRGRKGEG